MAGLPHHRLKDGNVVDHLVSLVEEKAAEIEKELAEADENPARMVSPAAS